MIFHAAKEHVTAAYCQDLRLLLVDNDRTVQRIIVEDGEHKTTYLGVNGWKILTISRRHTELLFGGSVRYAIQIDVTDNTVESDDIVQNIIASFVIAVLAALFTLKSARCQRNICLLIE